MCDHCQSRNESIGFLAGAIMGAAIGAAVGLLYAPQSGIKTREQLKKEATKTIREVQKNVRDFESQKVKPVVKKAEKAVNIQVKDIKQKVTKAVQDTKARFNK